MGCFNGFQWRFSQPIPWAYLTCQSDDNLLQKCLLEDGGSTVVMCRIPTPQNGRGCISCFPLLIENHWAKHQICAYNVVVLEVTLHSRVCLKCTATLQCSSLMFDFLIPMPGFPTLFPHRSIMINHRSYKLIGIFMCFIKITKTIV